MIHPVRGMLILVSAILFGWLLYMPRANRSDAECKAAHDAGRWDAPRSWVRTETGSAIPILRAVPLGFGLAAAALSVLCLVATLIVTLPSWVNFAGAVFAGVSFILLGRNKG